jgi:hypothetical protein
MYDILATLVTCPCVRIVELDLSSNKIGASSIALLYQLIRQVEVIERYMCYLFTYLITDIILVLT